MFRTVTVHPQELLCRYCMCRLWYVVRNALSDTSSWYNSLGRVLYEFMHITSATIKNTTVLDHSLVSSRVKPTKVWYVSDVFRSAAARCRHVFVEVQSLLRQNIEQVRLLLFV